MFGESTLMASDPLTSPAPPFTTATPGARRRARRRRAAPSACSPSARALVAERAQPALGRELRERRGLVVALLREALDRLLAEHVVAAVDPVRRRWPPSRNPRTTSSSSTSTSPNCDFGRATVIVASAPPARCAASSAAKSTSTSSSPFSASTSPLSAALLRRELDAAAAAEPLRLLGGDDLRADARELALEVLALARRRTRRSRASRRRARDGRPGTRRAACPATSTSAFGRPPAASPSRSALPPARMIASTGATSACGRGLGCLRQHVRRRGGRPMPS